MKYLAPVICFFAVILFLNPVCAREPAAVVVEVRGEIPEGEAPEVCKDIFLHQNTIFIQPHVDTALKDKTALEGIAFEPGLKYLEDVSRIVFLRTKNRCYLWFSELTLPPPADLTEITGVRVDLDRWMTTSGGSIIVVKGASVHAIKENGSRCLERSGNEVRCKLLIYNYGILPVYLETPKSKIQSLVVDSSVSGYFSGPGDRASFDVSIPSAGTLVVEFRVDGGPESVTLEIKDRSGGKIGMGSATFHSPDRALVNLDYSGTGRSGYDVGFLFIPDIPLSCRILTRQFKNSNEIEAVAIFQNITDKPVSAPLPGPGAVMWSADGRIIAGAHPGRHPVMHLYESGEERSYSIVLPYPERIKSLQATMKTEKYTVHCEKSLK